MILILWTNGALGAKKKSTRQTILIVGPSGAGKTSLYLSLVSQDKKAQSKTLTSQSPNQQVVKLPFSSTDETSTATIEIKDFPGHPKLFHMLEEEIKTNLRDIAGIVFVVDSAAAGKLKSASDPAATEAVSTTAQMLCKVLSLTERHPNGVDILIAGNKSDVFNALSASKLRSLLEQEILEIMSTKGKLLDANADSGNDTDSPLAWIADSDKFSFDELEGAMDVIDGSAKLGQVSSWATWIEQQIANH